MKATLRFIASFGAMLFALDPLAADLAARGDAPIHITVTPAATIAGKDVRVSVRIKPDANDRWLTIEADSANYYRGTEIELEGDRSASVHTLMLHTVPVGTYEIRAVLGRVGETVKGTPTPLEVTAF